MLSSYHNSNLVYLLTLLDHDNYDLFPDSDGLIADKEAGQGWDAMPKTYFPST